MSSFHFCVTGYKVPAQQLKAMALKHVVLKVSQLSPRLHALLLLAELGGQQHLDDKSV